MEQQPAWSPTATIAKRVRDVRAARGLSAQQLANELAGQGIAWRRSTVAKLENGNRENVSVAELFALAAALNVAPVHLMLPINGDDQAQYQVTPNRIETVERVRGWVRGHFPLPGGNVVKFQDEMPADEQGRIYVPPSKEASGRVTIEGLESVLEQVMEGLRVLREEQGRGER